MRADKSAPRDGISRRDLLVGGAAGFATQVLGLGVAGCQRKPHDYDLCIIGSGFAGIHLALRAVEHGMKTIVLEAGREFEPSFEYSTSGGVDYPVAAARQIALGGTSGHWGGMTSRMWPRNFQLQSEFGSLVDWPIGYQDLAPYYCESEQLLSVQGQVVEAGVEPPRSCAYPMVVEKNPADFGLSLADHSLEFFTKASSVRDGAPVRLADVEVPRFAKSLMGTLSSGQRVTEIVTRDGESVSHVVTQAKNGDTADVFARSFVVAAGVIESPRLLLTSRSKWFPQGIGNRDDQVGRNFLYHPHFGGDCTSGAKSPPFSGSDFRSHSLDEELLRKGMNACNLQLNKFPHSSAVSIEFSPDVEPVAENRLTLSPNRRDSLGLPLPNLHLDNSRRDQRTFRYLAQFGDRINSVLGGEEKLSYWSRFHSHPAGTCRMGDDASSGVVDRNNRVFGIDNLYVSGACVFPVSGATNPTNTVVALTLRLADHLIERHQAKG